MGMLLGFSSETLPRWLLGSPRVVSDLGTGAAQLEGRQWEYSVTLGMKHFPTLLNPCLV